MASFQVNVIRFDRNDFVMALFRSVFTNKSDWLDQTWEKVKRRPAGLNISIATEYWSREAGESRGPSSDSTIQPAAHLDWATQ